MICIALFLLGLVCISAQSNEWYNWYDTDNGEGDAEIFPTLSCPKGHFRRLKKKTYEQGGIQLDGCIKCPVGVYGDSTDLTSSDCTAPCPKGYYNDEEGITSIDDCKPCPPGTFGDEEGLTDSSCSGLCSDLNSRGRQYFSTEKALTSIEDCQLCPERYNYHSCKANLDESQSVKQMTFIEMRILAAGRPAYPPLW